MVKMRKQFIVLLILFLTTGCATAISQPIAKAEPIGMPRTSLIHKYLPGVLSSPEDERVSLCDNNETKLQDKNCALIIQALAGSSKAALSLASSSKYEKPSGNILYWYRIAAENGNASAMEKLGLSLYSKPFDGDPVGSKIRGQFWLTQAARGGNIVAQQYLETIDINKEQSADKLDLETSPLKNQYSMNDMLRCEKIRSPSRAIPCDKIPMWEREALAGSNKTADYLYVFLANHAEKPQYSDSLYWNIMGAENGSTSSMIILGELYWHGKGGPISRTRGKFWLNKAANHGDKSVLRQIEYFKQEDLKSQRH